VSAETTAGTETTTETLLSRRYVFATVGSFAIVFLGAYEALALTTVMPTISRALGGDQLYALSFAAPLATGLVGMVLTGQWCDRRGPATPLLAATASFGLGLIVCAVSPTMEVFVAGRLLQGLGGGGSTVALYVLVGLVYPAVLQPRVFAGFAAAWVLPSLVGPAIAAGVAGRWGWPWVFWSALVLTAAALALTWPVAREVASRRPAGIPWSPRRLVWAVLAASGVLLLDLLGQHFGLIAVAVTTIAIAIAVRPLVPRGALRAARGLPAVVSTRGLLAAAFFTAEAYVPFVLQDRWRFTPAAAGLALTVAGIAWAAASQTQARLGDRLSHRGAMMSGSTLLLAGTALVTITAGLQGSGALLIVAYGVASIGMGLAYPRTSVAMLGHSTDETRGFNSAALTVADSLAAAVAITLGGLAFRMTEARGGGDPFVADFLVAAAMAVLAVLAARRTSVELGVDKLHRSD
jgi:MFS family permease